MDEKTLIRFAIAEITKLRREKEIMDQRLDVYESMMQLFQTVPGVHSQGMAQRDILSDLRELLNQKEQNENDGNK